MLKVIRGLFLVVALVITNAYVPPTYATSANVIITHIQAGGAGAALQELIILYNNSADDVDISGWCVTNKTGEELGCFRPEQSTYKFYLPSGKYATIASLDLASTVQHNGLSIVYMPMNHSSGGIVGGSDTISLLDQQGVKIDQHSWTASLAGGTMLSRKLDPSSLAYTDTDQPTDWQVSVLQTIPPDGVERRDASGDLCLNIEGVQSEVPAGLERKWDGQCLPPLSRLIITEVLPNAAGSDTGKEFIELYNPNDYEVSLRDYYLNVGPQFENPYALPESDIIGPLTYYALDNSHINFTLLNTMSRVQLMGVDGSIIDETPSYENPKDDMAWALIDGQWQYAAPTPNKANNPSSLPPTTDSADQVGSLQPCAANQYRSTETNRCRLIATPATQAPCKDGQYRSEETNRCRNIAADANTPKPCKDGQERNLETNRCRNIIAMTKADYAVLGTQTSSNGSWYIWAAIIGLILAALGYAAWEWRYELRKLQVALWAKFVRKQK